MQVPAFWQDLAECPLDAMDRLIDGLNRNGSIRIRRIENNLLERISNVMVHFSDLGKPLPGKPLLLNLTNPALEVKESQQDATQKVGYNHESQSWDTFRDEQPIKYGSSDSC
jgi:hypothetical protein